MCPNLFYRGPKNVSFILLEMLSRHIYASILILNSVFLAVAVVGQSSLIGAKQTERTYGNGLQDS
jgi:hypothetical protein